MKIDNKDVFNHLVDQNLDQNLFVIATKILRHRNEFTLLCNPSQMNIVNYFYKPHVSTPKSIMGAYQRNISRRITQLVNLGLMETTPMKSFSKKNLKGPSQYWFLHDRELQYQLIKNSPNGTIPDIIRKTWELLTKKVASNNHLTHVYDPQMSYNDIYTILSLEQETLKLHEHSLPS